MFRLLGFLIGSATAIAIMLVVLGVPDFHLADPGIDQKRFDAAVEKLREKQQIVANVAEDIIDEVTEAVEDAQDNLEIVTEQALPEPSAELAEISPESQNFDARPVPDIQDLANVYPAIQDELQWYSFWNPFRSEIAARGFVTQLEKVTGLDYRVVKVKAGVYEVAFAYGNDMERRTKLSQISAATGLDLPDS